MLQAAEAHYRRQARLTALAVVSAQRTWDRLDTADLTGSWGRFGPRMVATVAAVQIQSAKDADPYLAAVLAEQHLSAPAQGSVNPRAFAAVAGDGRDLDTLLYEPVIGVKEAIGNGSSVADAMASGRSSLGLMVATAVQDIARAAVSTAMTARPRVTGYVRMLNPPSCERCAVLAGAWYRWNSGFQRHPHCDCRHVPSIEDRAGDLRTDPLEAIKSGQVTGLSKADTKAILDDGADPAQVLNAHRGMSTAQVFGQRLKVTSEGTTRRGLAGSRLGAWNADAHRPAGERYRRARAPRLMPESIYQIADSREDAIRLLKRNGFIL